MFRVRTGKGKRPHWLYFTSAKVMAGGILEVQFNGEPRQYGSELWERVGNRYSRIDRWQKRKALGMLIQTNDSRCALCGEKFAPSELTLDHIKPRSMGGSHALSNLQLACGPCNVAKGSSWDESEDFVTPPSK